VRRADNLVVHPLHNVLAGVEFRRIVADEEDIALLLGQAEHGDESDVPHLGAVGRDERRHVAHVADLLFIREHLADDHGPLETDLEFNFRSFGQMLLPEFQSVDDHAGP
jgi:hypothetical protein